MKIKNRKLLATSIANIAVYSRGYEELSDDLRFRIENAIEITIKFVEKSKKSLIGFKYE